MMPIKVPKKVVTLLNRCVTKGHTVRRLLADAGETGGTLATWCSRCGTIFLRKFREPEFGGTRVDQTTMKPSALFKLVMGKKKKS